MTMSPSDVTPNPDQSSSYEDALRAITVRHYANGEPVEGRYEIETPLADAPNWEIDVKKVYTDSTPEYDPEFID